jgi:exonuclease SbcD
LLICGDIFDVANPSAESQKLFYRFLKEVVSEKDDLQIIVISGNHDSPARLEAPGPLLEEFNVRVIGFLPRTGSNVIDYDKILIPISKKDEVAWCLAIPFIRSGDYSGTGIASYVEGISHIYEAGISYVEQKKKKEEALIVTGHLHTLNAGLSENDRCERLIAGGVEAVPATIFDERITYTALGHIHKAQRVSLRDNVRYAGSPLPMSFSEIGYKHQLVFVEIEKDQIRCIEEIEIPKLIPLLKIPNKPEILNDVLMKLSELPDKQDDDANVRVPYLEVNILLNEPIPSLKNRIEEALINKNVRLAKITSSYEKASTFSNKKTTNSEDLKKMNPIDILKKMYMTKFAAELPKDLEEAFSDAYRWASEDQGNK